MAKVLAAKTTRTRGRVHTYLEMELDFGTCPGPMIISMIKYLQTILDKFPGVLRNTKACPASDHLFKIRPMKSGNY